MTQKKKKPVPKGLRMRILRECNYRCFYCGGDATTVDHIYPYAWEQRHREGNLAGCCIVCNQIASDKYFDSPAEKITYVLRIRRKRGLEPQIQPRPKEKYIPKKDVSKVESTTFKNLRDRLTELHATESLRAISKRLYNGRVSHGTVDRCIKGVEPKDDEIRAIMGLPQIIQQKVFRSTIGRFRKAGDV